jgi:hypothetical protein
MNSKGKKNFKKNKVCACCGSNCDLEIDHIAPRAFGHLLDQNKQVLCAKCNRSKGILSIDYAKKLMILEPFIFSLNKKGIKELFNNTSTFSGVLLNPTQKEILKKYVNKNPILAVRQTARQPQN